MKNKLGYSSPMNLHELLQTAHASFIAIEKQIMPMKTMSPPLGLRAFYLNLIRVYA